MNTAPINGASWTAHDWGAALVFAAFVIFAIWFFVERTWPNRGDR